MYTWPSLAVAPPRLKIFIDLHQIWILDIDLLRSLSVIFDTLGKTHKSTLLQKISLTFRGWGLCTGTFLKYEQQWIFQMEILLEKPCQQGRIL